MHDFSNLNQILGTETVYQLWGFFYFPLKIKQIPISWIFCNAKNL